MLDSISPKVAKEALPEMGLVKIRGNISLGTPILSKNGDNKWVIRSLMPDPVNMLTPTIKAHIVGSSFIALVAPSVAPFKKLLK